MSEPKIIQGMEFHNADCVAVMSTYPDKHFDLAIVDPPYGIGESRSKESRNRVASRNYVPKEWDSSSPDASYFNELIRVSKNQIIWGANHFISKIPYDSPCWVVWDKKNGASDFADCELAWTSHKTAVRKFEFRWAGMLQEDMKNKEFRIHPTQKPVALYAWLLSKYATKGMKILDTHLGSGSIAIACSREGMSLVGCELDKHYFDAAMSRIERETAQVSMF